jgi:hypothetical protein
MLDDQVGGPTSSWLEFQDFFVATPLLELRVLESFRVLGFHDLAIFVVSDPRPVNVETPSTVFLHVSGNAGLGDRLTSQDIEVTH